MAGYNTTDSCSRPLHCTLVLATAITACSMSEVDQKSACWPSEVIQIFRERLKGVLPPDLDYRTGTLGLDRQLPASSCAGCQLGQTQR